MNKLCVFGSGRWGSNHIRTLHELGLLGGICETDSRRLAEVAAAYPDIEVFSSVEDALQREWLGVTIATPAHTHFEVAKLVIRAGFPLLVEKPLALSVEEAKEICDLAAASGVELMVGHLMLFHPAIEKIKELIDEGDLGRVQYIYSNRVNLGTVRKEENILWSFAPHDISIFQYLLGSRPVQVTSNGAAFLQPEIHDTTMTVLRYPGNVICHNYVSWLHPFKEHRLVVIGSKGMVRFDDTPGNTHITFYRKGIDWVNGEPIRRDEPDMQIEFDQKSPLEAELSYFANNARGKIDKADGCSALEVLEILEEASKQLVDGQTPLLNSDSHEGKLTLADQPASNYYRHASAVVDEGVDVGDGTKIWHNTHVQSGARIGALCVLGQNVNVGPRVTIGNSVRIQNNVSVFEGVELEDYVFCGPSMTFTNVRFPRAKYPMTSRTFDETLVKEGASIGAGAVIVCGNVLGKHCFVAAGAVVAADVPDYAFMIGAPAKQIGWVTEGGERIPADYRGLWSCSISGVEYQIDDDQCRPLVD